MWVGSFTFLQDKQINPYQRYRWPETNMHKKFDTIFLLIFHALSNSVIHFYL